MGRHGHKESRAEATLDQEGCGDRPQVARGLQQGACHHLGEARQEGGEVPRQGPPLPLHEQGSVRAQYGSSSRHGVEYTAGLPESDAAQGCHEGVFCLPGISMDESLISLCADGPAHHTARKTFMSFISCLARLLTFVGPSSHRLHIHIPTSPPPLRAVSCITYPWLCIIGQPSKRTPQENCLHPIQDQGAESIKDESIIDKALVVQAVQRESEM